MKRLLTLALSCLLLVGAASQAFAEDFDAIVAEGMTHYSSGEYDKAIEKFFQAKIIKDESELVYNIARAHHKKGDCHAAKQHYEMFLAREDAPEGTAEKARRHLGDLGECPTTGTLALACSPADATVQIDGAEAVPCGTVEIEQGEHVLIVTAEGYVPKDMKVSLEPGQVSPATVALDPTQTAGGGTAPDGEGTNWLAIGTLSAGGALIVSMVIIDVINYQGNAKQLEELPLSDSRARKSYEDSYELNQALMWITGGLGVAALATGAVFLAMDIGGGGSETAEVERDGVALQLAPAASPDGSVGAWLRLTF